MTENLHIPNTQNRAEIYGALIPQIESLISDEHDLIANLVNITAALHQAFGFLYIGFYRMIDGELVLGPSQGPLACTRIALSKGVCGACASEKRTIIVPDVEKFPGHIACSSLSKSEIVIPLIHANEVKLVLDLDSVRLAEFDESDAAYLELVVALIKRRHFSDP